MNRKMWRAPLGAALAIVASAVLAQAADPVVVPGSLAQLKRPEPANLSEFVANKAAAIALGKALFWDMRVGSDGKTACASCHFHAGADARSKNQLSPGVVATNFAWGAPNQKLKAADFPFHQFADPANSASGVVRSNTAVASSQGVYREQFNGVVAGQPQDLRTLLSDPLFNVGGTATRRVEPRNTPTVINAVFNLRNFWDGRAQTIFNGQNPFGKRDASAGIYKSFLPTNPLNLPNFTYKTEVTINDSSLASQASGPPLSDFEMSAGGRAFPDLGAKVLPMRPLAGQQVAADDSVLAALRHASGDGLATASYTDLVRSAFQPVLWNANQPVTVNGKQYTQMQANFSLFFGLAIQLYEATLVSDQAPWDKYAEGNTGALTPQQIRGLGVFLGKGNCVECHGGAAFTNAAIPRDPILGQTERITRMIMGNGATAVYDEGFYNIGITRTSDDLGVGGTDPWGKPLSFSRLATQNFGVNFFPLEQDLPNIVTIPGERVAADGAFKTPTLRNVELTAPFFHNGSVATLEQVVEFYNRGGNFAANNIANLDAEIEPLGLTIEERAALVSFLKALTDERVRRHAAPFDHPELRVPNGHAGNTASVTNDGSGRALEETLVVAAVGKAGYGPTQIPKAFLADVVPAVPPADAAGCAIEGGTCNIPSDNTATVWYGIDTRWVIRTDVGSSIRCDNGVFGDPAPGAVKGCRLVTVQPSAAATACAGEGGTCTLPAGKVATVWYGANKIWARRTGVTGSIACNNAVFGDPLFLVGKSCRYE